MTRSFRNWLRPRDDDDSELDELLAETWRDSADAIGRVLDFQPGKTALLAASRNLQEPAGSAGSTGGEDAALAAVCQEIGMLLAAVTAEIETGRGPAHSAVTAYLFAARKSLMQLRVGLLKRALAKTEARQIAGGVEHALTEASRTLRRLPPAAETSESEDLARLLGDLKEQLPALSRKIALLFDEAGDAAPRVPAPHF